MSWPNVACQGDSGKVKSELVDVREAGPDTSRMLFSWTFDLDGEVGYLV